MCHWKKAINSQRDQLEIDEQVLEDTGEETHTCLGRTLEFVDRCPRDDETDLVIEEGAEAAIYALASIASLSTLPVRRQQVANAILKEVDEAKSFLDAHSYLFNGAVNPPSTPELTVSLFVMSV